jgi:hypothetical protein
MVVFLKIPTARVFLPFLTHDFPGIGNLGSHPNLPIDYFAFASLPISADRRSKRATQAESFSEQINRY